MPNTKTIIKRSLVLFGIIIVIVVVVLLINHNPEEKKYTYELLEEDLGGVIEIDFQSVRECLKLIENHDYVVCGYIIEKTSSSMLGVDLFNIKITDDVEDSHNGNTVSINITQNPYEKVLEGDFIYASGTLNYVDYGTSKMENSVSMLCHTGGYISSEEIEGYSSVSDYIDMVREISENTWFQTEGVIMQDEEDSNGARIYRLYESKEAYKENKNGYITIEFIEEQKNLNGKIVTIMGRPDTNLFNGLVDCSIIEK